MNFVTLQAAMGLLLHQKVSGSAELGLWQIVPTDTFADILISDPEEKKKFLSLNKNRIKEILSARALLKKLMGKDALLIYDNHGKPSIKNSTFHISLSHSSELVAAIVEKRHSTGIDIQKITPKILRIRHKFLSPEEKLFSEGIPTETDVLHVLWGAKECMFKAHGKGQIIFSEQMQITPFEYQNQGEIKARLILPGQVKSFILVYKKIDSFMLVYVRELLIL